MESATVENIYGPNGSKVEQLHQRLGHIAWFSNCGKEQDIDNAIEWLTKQEALKEVVQNQSLLLFLDEHTNVLLNKANQLGRSAQVERSRDDYSEEIFHQVFDAAYQAFENDGSEVVKKVCENVMLVVRWLCVYEAVTELADEFENLQQSLLRLLESGHIPIAIENNQITAF